MISCACGAQWFGKYAVENPIIADHQGGRDGCRLVEHEEFLALGHRCKCGLCADGRRAARVGKRKAGTRAETTEPWNTETLADLQERRAAKFFLLISEESARCMAETAIVPLGVQGQCRHLLSLYDGDEPG